MAYWRLDPEVPGGWGDRIETTRGADGQPIVQRMHYEFGWGWLGDELITAHPVFMVTTALADTLRASALTGFRLSDDLEVTTDDQVLEVDPDWVAPTLEWLQVDGGAGVADFGLADHQLVVSDPALAVLRRHQLDHCDVEPYP